MKTLFTNLKSQKDSITAAIGNYPNVGAIMLFLMIMFVCAGSSWAIDPTGWNNATFGYTIYDIGVEKILKGPIGFVLGCACVGAGAVAGVRNMYGPAIGAIIGGAAMLKADAMTASLGMVLPF